ncbi:MAG TPA: adenylate/guanylate cyclase domain-containing protein [Burkholderiales bacterium]|nr:adenylate/guanylate cyclase domain-containing protein [Burkholderiales bacterium]
MRRFERRLRLATGLIVACFILGHFLNHSLGVVSIDAMDRVRATLASWWRSPPGTVLLYGALLVHFALALVSLYRRTTLRMPFWEAAQLVLGLMVPPLLIAHVVGSRFAWYLLGHNIDYERVVGILWSDPWAALRQAILLVIVWTHFCFGIHYWLRIQRWYPAAQPLVFAAALLVPTIALAGFAAAGNELLPVVERVGGMQKYNVDLASTTVEQRARLTAWREGLELGFWCLLGATLLARWLRTRLGGTYRLRHGSGRVITAPIGRSILEALRDEGVPHAAVCGGRARCTTCRVRISEGLSALPAPDRHEALALARVDAPPNVRLACQTRPRSDVGIVPLLPPGMNAATARRPGAGREKERPIVSMFVDLRGSTRIAESRLPYDVVFIMNQFFAEMYEALRATNGYYAQFRGDGLLALYGLDTDLPEASRQAMRGAAEMQRRIERLSKSLAADLSEPLRIGIGAHAGLAIIGTMGPPDAPIYSAIGDNVNIAARFEGMTKAYSCVMVVSAETLTHAGLEPHGATLHRVRVRGRSERLNVYAVPDPRDLFQEPATASNSVPGT